MINRIKNINMKIKKTIVRVSSVVGIITFVERPVYAMDALQIPGMDGVASSFKNMVGYAGLFFIAAGVVGAMFGAHQFFQALKSQDGESRNKSMIEFGAGLGSVAVGIAANVFKAYIAIQ